MWEAELREAWRLRRFYDCHRLANLLAGRRRGPRTRRYGHLAAARPSIDEWTDFLARPGGEGGLQATRVEFERERRNWIASLDPLPPRSPTHTRQAEDDLYQLANALMRAPRRRTAPECSLPSEVYLMAIRPFVLTGAAPGRRGVGFDPPERDMSFVDIPH